MSPQFVTSTIKYKRFPTWCVGGNTFYNECDALAVYPIFKTFKQAILKRLCFKFITSVLFITALFLKMHFTWTVLRTYLINFVLFIFPYLLFINCNQIWCIFDISVLWWVVTSKSYVYSKKTKDVILCIF